MQIDVNRLDYYHRIENERMTDETGKGPDDVRPVALVMPAPNCTGRGFTLIELICVIVILGVLAATAMPKFFDLRDDASNAVAQSVAAALTTAGKLNYAKFLASGSMDGVVDVWSGHADCNTLRPLLQESMPSSVDFVQGSLPYTCAPNARGGTSSVCKIRPISGGNQDGYPVIATCIRS